MDQHGISLSGNPVATLCRKAGVFCMGCLCVCVCLFVSAAQAQEATCGAPLKSASQGRFDEARTLFDQRKYAESNELLKKLLAKNPKSADVYFYLGLCAAKRDDNPAAIRRYFSKLRTLCPDYPDARAHYYAGLISYSDDKFDDAVDCFNRYFEIVNAMAESEDESPDRRNARLDAQALYQEASNYLYWSQFLADAYRNQPPFNPHVMLGVSSRRGEQMPYMTVDGKEMYYLRQIPANQEYTYYAKTHEELVVRLCHSRLKDTTFTEGEVLPSPFNQSLGEGGVTLTADNRLLYYSVLNPGQKGYSNVDIYFSQLKDDGWTPIEPAGINVNGDRSWESQPSITPDGQFLYFASNRQGGYGGIDIWRCRRLPNGSWSRAENLGPSVNTSGNEKSPFIHPDGKTLYFASNGWQGFGGYDMYFININDTYMQRPTNMGLPINTEKDDICFGVTTDGTQAYFAGFPTDGVGVGDRDVLIFDLYPAARPEPMRCFRGSLRSESGNPLAGVVKVIRPESDEAVYLVDSAYGKFALVLSEKHDNVVAAFAEGYMPSVGSFSHAQVRRGLNDGDFRFVLRPLMSGGVYPLNVPRLHSSFDACKPLLDVYVAFLLDHPALSVQIEASKAEDAKKIYDYLLSCKLRPERLTFRGGTDVKEPRLLLTGGVK